MRLGHLDAADSGVRKRAADESDIFHAGEPQVGHELAAPAEETIVLLAEYTGADALIRHERS
jgi:hypothetical protein